MTKLADDQPVAELATDARPSVSVRWTIAIMLGAAIAISYFDRNTLSVAVKAIQKDIPITDPQFARLQSWFLIAYAVMYAAGGKLLDVVGTRAGFALIMVWWSLACASHGLAGTFATLACSRLLLGMGEGGGFPAATKAVAEWFPVRERSTAMGIINAGTAVGGVVAAPGIALVLSFAHWPWVFYVSGVVGLLWTAWWLYEYFPPTRHPRISPAERGYVQQDVPGARGLQEPPVPWLRLLGHREVLGLVTAKFLTDAAWYFYMLWLPKYLYDHRGFDTKSVGYYAWIPFAAAGVGCLVGGWFSSFLIGRGYSLDGSRKVALGASAAVMPLMFFVTRVPVQWTIVLFAVAFFGQQSWSTLVMILPADMFPRRAVGSVAGMVGFGGAMGGVVFGEIVGQMLKRGTGYAPVFAIASGLHVAAFLLILAAVRHIRPIRLQSHDYPTAP
jgi:ACS family hexuronate transporter-like MFS transporter